MGLYTVLKPCVVGDLHYAQVPAEPIHADDAVAAVLVDSGDLAPVQAAAAEADEPKDEPEDEPEAEAPPHRRRTTKG